MTRYIGKKAVVTGGTIGIGLATAKALADEGAEVLITGRKKENLDAAQETLGSKGHVVRSDTTNLSDIDNLARVVRETFGEVDLVFINAGFAQLVPIDQVTVEFYDQTFDVNTKGAFFTAQRLAPLVRDGGAFVFTTSIADDSGNAGMSVYAGSKAALRSFAKGFAAELLPRGIRVNAISPGFIHTPTAGIADAPPELLASFEKLGDEITPMKRHGTAEEVAAAVLFLAFDATFTTGTEFHVDGGLAQRVNRPPEPPQ